MTEEQIREVNQKYYKKPLEEVENLVGPGEIKGLRKPERGSHKGMNGKVLIIGGSALFHGASLWALKAATRIVDMVFYSSVIENLEIAKRMKGEILDYITIPRESIEDYITEADVILIGPGMVRLTNSKIKNQKSKLQVKIQKLSELQQFKDEGEQTVALTDYLLHKYPEKQWVIDAGALQVMEVGWIPKEAILTPHQKEFEQLYSKYQNANSKSTFKIANSLSEVEVKEFAKTFQCLVVLKGERDIITDGEKVKYAEGGNAGMTKGGTGDVLAGVIAGFAAKNDPFLSACAGSFLNKLAGEMLFEKANTMFNATDLCDMIPEAYNRSLKF